jgi:Rod binding domain-containing protein
MNGDPAPALVHPAGQQCRRGPVRPPGGRNGRSGLRGQKATKAAIEFESFFIAHMLHQMRDSARTLAPEDSPNKQPVNQDMLDMADGMLAGHLAGQRAFGVADAILRSYCRPGLTRKN